MTHDGPGARKSLLKKITAAAGTLSGLAMIPATARGGVVEVSDSPISLSLSAPGGTTVTWDVDGAGGTDFRLFRVDGFFTTRYPEIHLGSAAYSGTYGYAFYNGRGLVGPTSNYYYAQPLASSFQVGPTLDNGYLWQSGPYIYRGVLAGGPTGGPRFLYNFANGFVAGENFFGFRFLDAAGGTHYGYGVIDFDFSAPGAVTISRWAYETDADTAIHVQGTPIPEPGTSALMLLGLGAGGLLAWRNRRKKAAEADEAV